MGRGTHCSKAAQNRPNLGKRSNRSFKDLLLQRRELSSLIPARTPGLFWNTWKCVWCTREPSADDEVPFHVSLMAEFKYSVS